MVEQLTNLRGMNRDATLAVVDRAAEVLREGGLVVLPTETVYGIAASAASPAGLAKFAALKRSVETSRPWTWHAPTRAAVERAIPLSHPLHRRLLKRLTPGPVRFVVELGEKQCQSAIEQVGALPGVLDGPTAAGRSARQISVRIPSHPVAAAVLGRSGVPVLVERLSVFGLGDDPSADGFDALASQAGFSLVLNDGPSPTNMPATTVVLNAEGFVVASEGALTERAIMRQLTRSVLFVCTGNTCRSPMAAAIAKHLLKNNAQSGAIETNVASAGIASAGSAPATPEAVQALANLGVELSAHRSRALTQRMIADAEIIYAMTRAHMDAVLAMDPDAKGKVKLLDPSGKDIPDPIGGGPGVYERTARRMLEAVAARLKEAESP